MIVINATISNLEIITITTMVVPKHPRRQGNQKPISFPEETFLFSTTGRGGRLKNLYTKSKKLAANIRVTWACSETVNLHN